MGEPAIYIQELIIERTFYGRLMLASIDADPTSFNYAYVNVLMGIWQCVSRLNTRDLHWWWLKYARGKDIAYKYLFMHGNGRRLRNGEIISTMISEYASIIGIAAFLEFYKFSSDGVGYQTTSQIAQKMIIQLFITIFFDFISICLTESFWDMKIQDYWKACKVNKRVLFYLFISFCSTWQRIFGSSLPQKLCPSISLDGTRIHGICRILVHENHFP